MACRPCQKLQVFKKIADAGDPKIRDPRKEDHKRQNLRIKVRQRKYLARERFYSDDDEKHRGGTPLVGTTKPTEYYLCFIRSNDVTTTPT